MCVSPVATTSRSTLPWRAMTSSMCERNPIGVSMRERVPSPSRFSVTATFVSFVARVRGDIAHEDAAREERLEDLLAAALRAECDEIRLRREERDARNRAHRI